MNMNKISFSAVERFPNEKQAIQKYKVIEKSGNSAVLVTFSDRNNPDKTDSFIATDDEEDTEKTYIEYELGKFKKIKDKLTIDLQSFPPGVLELLKAGFGTKLASFLDNKAQRDKSDSGRGLPRTNYDIKIMKTGADFPDEFSVKV